MQTTLRLNFQPCSTHVRVTALIESPLEIGVARNTYSLARADVGSSRSRFDLDALAYSIAVEAKIDSECAAQSPGSAGEPSHIIGASSILHSFDSSGWLCCAYQHRPRPGAVGGEVKAVVHSIDEIDVDVAERGPHYHRLPWPHHRMRCRVGGIGFGLDDSAFTGADDQDRSDQVASNRNRVA